MQRVYQRLFREQAETQAMLRKDGSGLVQASMLALTIEAILDFAGERRGHCRMIHCEASSHDAYGTPQELFIDFFRVIRDALRELLGDEWSPDTDDAWKKLLFELATFAGVPV